MDIQRAKNEVKDKFEKTGENAKKIANDASDEIVQSGKDWVNYIETHPFQSVIFGIIGYYALKGLLIK